ncbi:cbb3-type cytochrome c oxidase subunit 3 [Amaricoccus sp.]|uniref:cbb3-type cytochrome oxidase subunit 3 n=1 Tax=Amaricoccus sp. TaxID=1872485 RepID=UPI002604DD41|nr:cbb3-type cytochrome c oxidase subunit 3 [Amaricoccus sp.]HRO12102.1 cbb3-type cytochrome c oxidase subunit 3 [Amaricoccus sp.]
MSHDLLVYLAKTLGLFWMMGFFLIVLIRTYSPRRRAGYERVARSILTDDGPEERP